MKLIVGLGNPGKKYEHTRHNVGFMTVDQLAGQEPWQTFTKTSLVCTPAGHEQCLLKPQTFMNESGVSVAEVAQFYKIEPPDLWVVHDDLDLPFGTVRTSFDSSSAGHRGIESIIGALGTQKFHRLRLGLGRPPEHITAEAFVLQPFTPAEQKQLGATIKLAVQKLNDDLQQPT